MATVEELQARQDEIKARLTEIDSEHRDGGIEEFPEAAKVEWNTLNEELDALRSTMSEAEARRKRIEELSKEDSTREPGFNIPSPGRVTGDAIYDLSTIRAAVNGPEEATRELKERAKRAIEQGQYAADGVPKEEAQATAEALIDRVDHSGALARRMLETGSPTYMRAFGKQVMGRNLSDAEARALSTTDASGGFAIPFTLDPSVIHTSNYSVNPFRAISRVVQVTGDNWNGIASTGVAATYGAEAAEVSDGSPAFTQPSIHPERAHCFIPFSVELGQDWGGLQAELTSMIGEAKDDLEAAQFATGTGTNAPQGVILGGGSALNSGTTASFQVSDLYATEQALPPRYRPRAQWVANRAIYNRVRQFDTSGGANLWTENLQRGLANMVPTPGNTGYNLLGYQANEASSYGTALATGSTIATLGDFSRYVIVDRIGMNVEIIPHLFGTVANYPTGQRGLWAMWRNSAERVDNNAFRSLVTV